MLAPDHLYGNRLEFLPVLHGFVSLDLRSEAKQAEKEPEAFLRRHPSPVMIDEVPYAPALFRYLQVAVDAARVRRDRR